MGVNKIAELTRRQRDILRYIIRFNERKGFQPTYREIMEHFGISSFNGVSCHFKALEKKGYIKRSPKLARSLQILKEPK